MSRLEIGAIIPNAGPAPSQLGITEMALALEGAGAASVWVSDHLVFRDRPNTDYPFSEDGVPSWDMTVDYYEALACCAAIAAATGRVRLGTAVLVLPQRNAIEVAKTVATVDRLSDGRLDLGVGAGWNRDEFEALGYDFESRGRRFDEMLEVLRAAWAGRPPAFAGEQVRVPEDVVLVPTPVAREGVPLLVGGLGKPARRRAAALGDGWLAIAFTGKWDPEGLSAGFEDVRERRAELGAEPLRTVLKLHAAPDELERSLELLAEVAEIGFDEVIVEPPFAHGLDDAAALVREALAVAPR